VRTPAFVFGTVASLLVAGCNTVAVERSVVVDTVAAPAPYPVAPAPYPVAPAPYPVAPAPYPVGPAPLPPESCYADDADWALGAQASARVVERATFESGARTARVIQPGEFYTQEYRPDRLNIHVDPRGRIVDLRCG
jgi:hypothetical protein